MTTGETYARARRVAELHRYDAALELLTVPPRRPRARPRVHHLRSVCLRLTARRPAQG